jgi:hypothetical protein
MDNDREWTGRSAELRGDAELTAEVEQDAAELAGVRADEVRELLAEQAGAGAVAELAAELAARYPQDAAMIARVCRDVTGTDPVPVLRLPAGVRLTTAGELRAELAAAELDPVAALDQLGAKWSPDLDDYAAGRIDAAAIRCVLCEHAPCDCPPFGSPAYLALVGRRYGRKR